LYFENCDDGNLVSGDGCDDQCNPETGWNCIGLPSVCNPICGDSYFFPPKEVCEDGNKFGVNDGC